MLFTPTPVFRPNEKKDETKRLKRQTSICAGILGFGGAFTVVVSAVLFFYAPSIIKYFVMQQRQLSPDGFIYSFWKKPPVRLLWRVYFFNITNYQEYLDSNEKPILDEVGPYVYSQVWVKNNIVWNDNGTVSYRQNKTFNFEPSLSKGSENDIIFTVNAPMLTAAALFKNAGPVLKVVLTTVFTVSHETLVMNATAKQFMWEGYDDPILKTFKQIVPNALYPYSRFAFFYKKNDTASEGTFTVFTGKGDESKTGIIDNWNGKKYLNKWAGPKCNKIRGTPGEMFPPGVRTDQPIVIFVPDVCRTFELDYVGPETRFGVKGLRFELTPRTLQNASENPENACYCPGKCLPSGAVNISRCQFEAPIAISLPHFLHGDPRYLKQVTGMKPDSKKHSLYVVIEPMTGLVLDAVIQLQINVMLEKIPGISHFEHVNNSVIPIMRFSQTAEYMEQEKALIRLVTVNCFTYANIAIFASIAAGLFLIAVGIIYYLYQRRKWMEDEI